MTLSGLSIIDRDTLIAMCGISPYGVARGAEIRRELSTWDEYSDVTQTRFYGALNRLVESGYFEVEPHTHDNRSKAYSITDKGRTEARQYRERIVDYTDSIYE